MNIEKFLEKPQEPSFIALSYAETVADDDNFEIAVISKTDASWKIQIEGINANINGEPVAPTLAEVELFVSAVIEYLDDDYPERDWSKMISVTKSDSKYNIIFETD